MPYRAGEAEPIIDVRSSEVKFKVFVAPWTQLAWKPSLPLEPRLSELGCWDVASLVPAAPQGRIPVSLRSPCWHCLEVALSGCQRRHIPQLIFLLDWEKPVSCQDFWGGTETTVYFPDAILSVCWPCLEYGECFLPVPALVFGWVMAMTRITL